MIVSVSVVAAGPVDQALRNVVANKNSALVTTFGTVTLQTVKLQIVSDPGEVSQNDETYTVTATVTPVLAFVVLVAAAYFCKTRRNKGSAVVEPRGDSVPNDPFERGASNPVWKSGNPPPTHFLPRLVDEGDPFHPPKENDSRLAMPTRYLDLDRGIFNDSPFNDDGRIEPNEKDSCEVSMTSENQFVELQSDPALTAPFERSARPVGPACGRALSAAV